jgi:hypothetical protein
MAIDYSSSIDPRSPLEINYDGDVITNYTFERGVRDVPITNSVRDVIGAFVSDYNSSFTQQRVNLMRQGGWIGSKTKSPSTIVNSFVRVLAMAQNSNRSVDEILLETASMGDQERSGAGGPFRSETTSVTEYDATNVTDIANNAARQRLGRAATKKERELLATALNEAQRKSPMVTISEGTTTGGTTKGEDGQRTARGTVSTTTTRGGINPAEIAAEQAVQAEDFEERFFVSAFTDMLKDLAKPAV